jgi:hypothetical protein
VALLARFDNPNEEKVRQLPARESAGRSRFHGQLRSARSFGDSRRAFRPRLFLRAALGIGFGLGIGIVLRRFLVRRWFVFGGCLFLGLDVVINLDVVGGVLRLGLGLVFVCGLGLVRRGLVVRRFFVRGFGLAFVRGLVRRFLFGIVG